MDRKERSARRKPDAHVGVAPITPGKVGDEFNVDGSECGRADLAVKLVGLPRRALLDKGGSGERGDAGVRDFFAVRRESAMRSVEAKDNIGEADAGGEIVRLDAVDEGSVFYGDLIDCLLDEWVRFEKHGLKVKGEFDYIA